MHTLPPDAAESSPPDPIQATASQPPLSPSKTIILGLSGPSSSGKTTLARLLRSIFNVSVTVPVPVADTDEDGNGTGTGEKEYRLSLFILHQDDFYKTDKEVPWVTVSSPRHGTRTEQDWDCVGSLDLPLFRSTLSHVCKHGTLPPDIISIEDQNSVGDVHVSSDDVNALNEQIRSWFAGVIRTHIATISTTDTHTEEGVPREIRICVLEGFLLYPPSPTSEEEEEFASTARGGLAGDETDELVELYDLTHELLSAKLFLPCTKSQMVERREKRAGYVTLEGFWTDPPGYVEDVVWVNYKRYHGWMYQGDAESESEGEGEGEVFDEQRCRDGGVKVFLGPNKEVGKGTMKEGLAWGVGEVKGMVEALLEI
ncbi:ribosylnicotinamide kinase [Exophiala xenobiotica]|nr:ribosylnicotinamide kinase [Exophiala xenobiotica]